MSEIAGDLEYSSETDDFLKKYMQSKFKMNLEYLDYTDEDELISKTKELTMIVHFYCTEFEKCKLLNRALKTLSPKFVNVHFASINVDRAPKMCKCLEITCLPFLGFFRDGYFVDKLVGFEKLGNSDTFEIETLEKYIENSYLFKDIEE